MIRRGSLLIEVLLSAGFLAIFGMILGSLIMMTSRTNHSATSHTQALAYAQESMEELVALKNANWSDFSHALAGQYRIGRGAGTFTLIPIVGDETLGDGFSRRIAVTTVYRDASNAIASSGTVDPNTRLVTVTVAWTEHGQPQHVVLQNYFVNWQSS